MHANPFLCFWTAICMILEFFINVIRWYSVLRHNNRTYPKSSRTVLYSDISITPPKCSHAIQSRPFSFQLVCLVSVQLVVSSQDAGVSVNLLNNTLDAKLL